MSTVALLAKLPAAEGKGAELAEAFKAAFEHVNKESGTRMYVLHADASNADILWIYEIYENQDAMNAHMTAEHGLDGDEPHAGTASHIQGGSRAQRG